MPKVKIVCCVRRLKRGRKRKGGHRTRTGSGGFPAGAAAARVGEFRGAAEDGARVPAVRQAEVVVDVVAVDAVVLLVRALLVVAPQVPELVVAVRLQRRRHLAGKVRLYRRECVCSCQETLLIGLLTNHGLN